MELIEDYYYNYVHSLDTYVYWTDLNTNRIEEMTLSGKNRHAIVSSNLYLPNNLTR